MNLNFLGGKTHNNIIDGNACRTKTTSHTIGSSAINRSSQI